MSKRNKDDSGLFGLLGIIAFVVVLCLIVC